MATRNLLKTLREADKNLIETGVNVASGVTKAVRDELSEEWRTSVKQMLGLSEAAKGALEKAQGDLAEGEEISFVKAKQEKTDRMPQKEAAIEYHRDIIHAETRHIQAENQELRQRIQQIQVELVKIRQTSKELESTFQSLAVETLQAPVEVGTYHVNFFEWLSSMLQNARARIESSASWISVVAGKKSKKDYWSLSKSQGTSFSLSGERVVAQQTG